MLAVGPGALAAFVASALGRPQAARAGTDGDVVLGGVNDTTNRTLIRVTNPGANNDVFASTHAGVSTGVYGESGSGVGVWGHSLGNPTGVIVGDKAGVRGESHSPDGSGVHGLGWNSGTGVAGVGRVGVFGISSENGWFGIWGRHTGNSPGVNGDSSTGAGVHGSSTSGYGGHFEGGKSQLRLTPRAATGKPTGGAHLKGEIYMDSKGALFVCVANGTPGTWRKVTTRLV